MPSRQRNNLGLATGACPIGNTIEVPLYQRYITHSESCFTSVFIDGERRTSVGPPKVPHTVTMRHAFGGDPEEYREDIVASFCRNQIKGEDASTAKIADEFLLKAQSDLLSSLSKIDKAEDDKTPLEVIESLLAAMPKNPDGSPAGITVSVVSPELGEASLIGSQESLPKVEELPVAPHNSIDGLTKLPGYSWLLGGENLNEELEKRNSGISPRSFINLSIDLLGAGILDNNNLGNLLEDSFMQFEELVTNAAVRVLKDVYATRRKLSLTERKSDTDYFIPDHKADLKKLISCSRPGGDEFNVILPNLHDNDAIKVIVAIRDAIVIEARKRYKPKDSSTDGQEYKEHNEKIASAQRAFAEKNGAEIYAKLKRGVRLGYPYIAAVRFVEPEQIIGESEDDYSLKVKEAYCCCRDMGDKQISKLKYVARSKDKHVTLDIIMEEVLDLPTPLPKKRIHTDEILAVSRAADRHNELIDLYLKEESKIGRRFLLHAIARNSSLKAALPEPIRQYGLTRYNKMRDRTFRELIGIQDEQQVEEVEVDVGNFGGHNKVRGPADADQVVISESVHSIMVNHHDFPLCIRYQGGRMFYYSPSMLSSEVKGRFEFEIRKAVAIKLYEVFSLKWARLQEASDENKAKLAELGKREQKEFLSDLEKDRKELLAIINLSNLGAVKFTYNSVLVKPEDTVGSFQGRYEMRGHNDEHSDFYNPDQPITTPDDILARLAYKSNETPLQANGLNLSLERIAQRVRIRLGVPVYHN